MKEYYKSRAVEPSPIIQSRIEGAYHRFLAGFAETKGLRHAQSKGNVRENPVSAFFSSLLPRTFGVTAGEIIDIEGNVSPQSDCIIYRNSDGIPMLAERPTILQVESVMCVTEVKSEITAQEYEDCLLKAQKLFALKPFGQALQKYERNREPTSEECRVYNSIFAYSSDIKGGLPAEFARFMRAAERLKIDPYIIDRIYILGKGVINPKERRFAEDRPETKRGLFYLYSNVLQFLVRESRRRKPVPYVEYFGRMTQGWERIE